MEVKSYCILGKIDSPQMELDQGSVTAWVNRGRLPLRSVNSNLDSAYNSDESPTLTRPLRCGSCRSIPNRPFDSRLLPCGHFFCASCSTSCTPEYSLTLYCPICGDQSIAPYENECVSKPCSENEFPHKLHRVNEIPSNGRTESEFLCDSLPETGRIIAPEMAATSNQAAKDAWNRLQIFAEACRRRIDDADSQRRYHSPSRSSNLSDVEEFEELEGSFNSVIRLLQRQENIDRNKRILSDLRNYENRLKNAISRLNAPVEERGEQWRRSFADAKTILRTLSTRAKLEFQRLENEDKRSATKRTLGSVSNGNIHKAYSQAALNSDDAMPSSSDTSISPWTITVTGEGALRCRRGMKNTLTLTAKKGNGDPVHLDSAQFSAHVVSAASGKRASVVSVRESSTKGVHELTYYVNREGAYQLIIKFAGRHIGGSPFPIRCLGDDSGCDYYNGTSPCSVHSSGPLTGSRATSYSSGGRGSSTGFGKRTITTTFSTRSGTQSRSPRRRRIPIEDDLVMQCGSHGRGYGQFSNPQGICCTNDGQAIVADSNNQCVQVFDLKTGQCKFRFGTRGRTAGELQRPTGVAVLPSSRNILVADYDNRWISVHDPNGKYLGRFGAGKMLGPRGIAVDADDHLIIVDNKASTILVYDLCKFKFVRQFGSRGDRLEQLAGPHYCAVNPITNFLYLTDFHHHCVKVFDCRGQYQFSFGSLGEGNGQFQAPTGIAIDANQNVLVADWGNSRIQIFDQSGSFLSYVNSFAHPLFGPQGLAMTSDGHIAVADTGNHCFKLYRFLS